jgi:hypothetical protein
VNELNQQMVNSVMRVLLKKMSIGELGNWIFLFYQDFADCPSPTEWQDAGTFSGRCVTCSKEIIAACPYCTGGNENG